MNSEKFPICNISIELTLLIEPILNHPVVKQLFEKLQENQIIKKETSHQDWVKMIVEDYKNKARETISHQDLVKWAESWKKEDDTFEWNTEPHAIERVNFRIKDNFLFINDKIDFRDFIYHKIFIPWPLQKMTEIQKIQKHRKDSNGGKSFCLGSVGDPRCIHDGMQIRVFVVNGIIKLQIGEFDIGTSPDVISESTFQRYITITSFPLLYYPSIIYQIPENRLQVSAEATDSWWKGEKLKQVDKEFDKHLSDIRKINKEISDFYLISEILTKWDGELGKTKDWELENEKRQTLIDQFSQKAKEWLARECFEGDEHGGWYGIFHNKYLVVQIGNWTSDENSWGKRLSDYFSCY